MFLRYLRRELTRRSKQTVFISLGLAVAIGLVVVVNGAAGGIKSAQSKVLSSLYGIGTDISITKADTTFGGGGPRQFDIGGSTNSSGKNQFNRSSLRTQPGTATLTSNYVTKVAGTSNVSRVVSTLRLENFSFSGTLPTFNNNSGQTGSTGNATPIPIQGGGQISGGNNNQQGDDQNRPRGGFDGNGGSRFDINRMSVEGVGLSADSSKIGPLSTLAITSGVGLTAADAGKNVALVDSTYATSASLKLGSKVTISDTKFIVIGLAKSTSTAAATSSNVYIPLDVAQKLSSNTGKVTNIYVSANSSDNISGIQTAIKKLDKKATVNSSSDLASTVTGSLSSASSIVNNVGTWLSLAVLLAAFLTAILFTMSGVNRRVREFGTLKALGWKSSRVVKQVMGESLVTGLLGGVFGIVLGLSGIALVNALSPSLSASLQRATGFGGGPGGFGPGGDRGPGGFGQNNASNAVNVALNASASWQILLAAIGLALLGGLLAGAIGGLRAAKLSPAQALRSVE